MSKLKTLSKPQLAIFEKLRHGDYIICTIGGGRRYALASGAEISRPTFDALWRAGVLNPGNDGLDVSTAQTYRAKGLAEL